MKKTLFLIILSLPGLLSGKYYGEMESALQLNHPTGSSVCSAPARLRLGAEGTTLNSNIRLHFRMSAASGKAYFGSTGLLAPANTIAADSREWIPDKAYLSYEKGFFHTGLGLLDMADILPDRSGFFNRTLIGNESSRFLSSHFLWLLANNGLDQFYRQSLPGFFLFLRVTDNIRLKAGMTFGQASEHLFLRNTLPFELEWNSRSFHLSLNAGFGDAHSSHTHKISPSWGIILEKRVMRGIYLFGRFSRAEKDLKTYRTPRKDFASDYLTAAEFSGFKEHGSWGLVLHAGKTAAGAGFSQAQNTESRRWERVIEMFFRFPLWGAFDLTPDFQYVMNPAGEAETKFMWIAGLRFYCPFEFN